MGDKQRVGSFAPDERERVSSSSPIFYKDVFYKCLPYYMSIGMTATEYFEGDAELVIYYRKAHELKIKEQNMMLWLQGRYIYDALAEVSPMYNSFKPSKPMDYNTEPYPLTKSEREYIEKKNKLEQMQKAKEYMNNWMNRVNKAKGGEVNGSDND